MRLKRSSHLMPCFIALLSAWCITACSLAGCTSSTIVGSAADGPNAPRGHARIEGLAQIIDEAGDLLTCAGRRVLLVPKTPVTAEWTRKLHEKTLQGPGIASHFVKAFHLSDEPEVVSDQGRFTLGYGPGKFEFTDVAVGEYFIVFRYDDVASSSASVAVRRDNEIVKGVEAKAAVKNTEPRGKLGTKP